MHDASSESHGGGRLRGADRPPPFVRAARAAAHRLARGAVLALVLVVPGLHTGCRPRGSGEAVTATPARPLADVLAARTPEWMKLPGVVGTAESRLDDGRPCILVMVVRLTPELRRSIPGNVEGWPVRIEETGEIHAMPDSGR